jgi:hypothetical protein
MAGFLLLPRTYSIQVERFPYICPDHICLEAFARMRAIVIRANVIRANVIQTNVMRVKTSGQM